MADGEHLHDGKPPRGNAAHFARRRVTLDHANRPNLRIGAECGALSERKVTVEKVRNVPQHRGHADADHRNNERHCSELISTINEA